MKPLAVIGLFLLGVLFIISFILTLYIFIQQGKIINFQSKQPEKLEGKKQEKKDSQVLQPVQENVIKLKGKYRLIPVDNNAEAYGDVNGEVNQIVLEDYEKVESSEAIKSVEQQAQTQPVQEEVSTTEIVEGQYADGKVVFSLEQEKLTYEQSFEKLNNTQKGYIQDLIDYALSLTDEAKKAVRTGYATVVLRNKCIVKIIIKKDVVTAKLNVYNMQLREYSKTSDVKIKEKPIDVKLKTAESVETAKGLVKIACENLLAKK